MLGYLTLICTCLPPSMEIEASNIYICFDIECMTINKLHVFLFLFECVKLPTTRLQWDDLRIRQWHFFSRLRELDAHWTDLKPTELSLENRYFCIVKRTWSPAQIRSFTSCLNCLFCCCCCCYCCYCFCFCFCCCVCVCVCVCVSVLGYLYQCYIYPCLSVQTLNKLVYIFKENSYPYDCS